MRFLSLFSGIEAATQAWKTLGWEPAGFAEIEPFPAAVLAHHYPSVPNLGDVTKYQEWHDIGTVDLICGGSPCQDYSIAGQRLGMAGGRGQLTLTYIEIAAWYRPRWLVYENVPGILSSNGGRDFARFLGDLTGQTISVPKGGWKNSGIVAGIPDAFGLAWRVLDAQHVRTRRFPFAVPQRRRRVWVVGYLGDWRRAAAVLFDRESLSGHPAPRREAGQGIAVSPSLRAQCQSSHRLDSEAFVPVSNSGEVGYCLTASAQGSLDAETETLIAAPHPITLMQLGRDDGPSIEWRQDGTANALLTPNGGRAGMGVGCVAAPVAFQPGNLMRGCGASPSTDVFPTLTASHGRGMSDQDPHVAIPAAFDLTQITSATNRSIPQPVSPTMAKASNLHAFTPWQVRRLTPVEAERLQGFPDNFTAIPWRGKSADQCPDGPRYKALGNSWAVNCAEWIGERIALVEALNLETAA